jgi:pimeloyl-ACP methyl ester carboxylesterase
VLDVEKEFSPLITQLTARPNPNFALTKAQIQHEYDVALGPESSDAMKQAFSVVTTDLAKCYAGDTGRIKLNQAAKALVTRDSLVLRLEDLKAPVLWIASSNDHAVPVKAAKDEAALFKREVQFEVIEGAYHCPTWTHAEEVNKLVIAFVKKHGGMKDARELREANGMVDI